MEVQILTEHFSLEGFTRSSTALQSGICNEPPIEVISNLQNLCQEVLEPLRLHYGKPIHISSGYRCKELNKRVGGVKNSQHLKGEAADLLVPSVKIAKEWFEWIQQNCWNYDQCILERNKHGKYWLHVSARRELHYNRHQAFLLVKR